MNRKASAADGVSMAWRKSSYSSNGSDIDCVEVAHTAGVTHVRDSKNAQGPRLAVGSTAWADFVTYATGSRRRDGVA
ncbi:DUF397 domain-containing protein [Streptomyces silvensis]|uniref:DUF397 domain-containing protein n=1 Tax=Streptomyces silvensis TaxID=1765722 RepID=A0A0W7X4H3_9ACTN|nr:DUF397 domain-containing protein [Streptomyces silvensis]KUF17659.1 DUF397 domain-containing protein [Streptomyces silvensis]